MTNMTTERIVAYVIEHQRHGLNNRHSTTLWLMVQTALWLLIFARRRAPTITRIGFVRTSTDALRCQFAVCVCVKSEDINNPLPHVCQAMAMSIDSETIYNRLYDTGMYS
jgi:hypothetical protein